MMRGLMLLGSLAILAACRSPSKMTPTEVRVSDSSASARSDDVTQDTGATLMTLKDDGGAGATTEEGWLLKDPTINPQYTARAEVIAALKSDPRITHRALVMFQEKIEECSSAGGTHAFFELVSPNKGVVHLGGHGAYLTMAFPKKGALWVVGYAKVEPPESVKNEVFCVPDRTIHGRAIGMVPVATRTEGDELLARLMR